MSNHWYDDKGNEAYTIVGTNGKERDTTLRDARKFRYVPSVTTILDIPSKPGLDIWKQSQLLKAAFKYKQFEVEEKEWSNLVLHKSKIIGKQAALKGQQIHEEIELNIKNSRDVGELNEYVAPVLIKLLNELGDIKFICEKSFSYKKGFGGKVDLHGNGFVLDFKTKLNSLGFDKDLGYDNHCMQLAAYRLGLDMPKAKCYNLFISTEVPGLLQWKEWTEKELEKGLNMFLYLLKYWQLSNNYDSSFEV